MLREQEDVARRTAEVGRRTLAQELRDLSPQNVADLRMLADRQLELARLLDRLLQEMDQAGGELRQNDPSAAKTVAEALEQARRLAISGQMRTGGQQIEQNQIGQAAAGQKQIVRDLQEVLDMLAARQTGKSNTAAASPSESGTSRTPSGAGPTEAGSADGQTPGDRAAASASPRPAGDGKDRRLDQRRTARGDQAALGPIARARPRANAAIARRGVPSQVRSVDRRVFPAAGGGEGRTGNDEG